MPDYPGMQSPTRLMVTLKIRCRILLIPLREFCFVLAAIRTCSDIDGSIAAITKCSLMVEMQSVSDTHPHRSERVMKGVVEFSNRPIIPPST